MTLVIQGELLETPKQAGAASGTLTRVAVKNVIHLALCSVRNACVLRSIQLSKRSAQLVGF